MIRRGGSPPPIGGEMKRLLAIWNWLLGQPDLLRNSRSENMRRLIGK